MNPVRSVELRRVTVPLRHAHRAAHGTESDRSVVVVRLERQDGSIGWGECSALRRPTYTAEYTAGAWRVLRDELVPAVLAGRPSDVVGHPMAAAGLATALLDARLRASSTPLSAYLAERSGGDPLPSVPWTSVVGRGASPDDLVATVGERLAVGATMVKLKVTPLDADLDGVAAVRSNWPELAIAVDFNGTADLASLRRLDPLHLTYVEQPAPADDLVGSARLAQAIGAPVALDESVASEADLATAAALGAGSLVNVKPARCGGLDAALTIALAASTAGMGAFVGGMLETGIGRAAALALAAVPGLAMPTDLGPSAAYFDADLVDPLVLDHQGRVVVPEGPGIGRTPVEDALDRCTTDRWSLSR